MENEKATLTGFQSHEVRRFQSLQNSTGQPVV